MRALTNALRDGRRARTRALAIGMFLLCTLLAGVQAYADQVTPRERVKTRLRIRAAPTTESPIIGSLEPGETAPLRRSLSHWYEVTTPDGRPGFVSKAWARLIPDSPLAARELRLGAWNIRKLGHGSSKDFNAVASVIEAHFDIVAVIEVMQRAGGHPGYDALIAHLGPAWRGLITDTPRPNTSSGSAEFYAILYRSDRLRTWDDLPALVYHPDHDGSPTGAGHDRFSREPAFGCFVAIREDGSDGFDFMLAAYHARWADGDILDIQSEVEHLEEVFRSMQAVRPNERDLLIIGDFNLRPPDLENALGRPIDTIGTGSTLNSNGAITDNLYDHLVIADLASTSERIGPATVLDVRSVAADPRTFFRTVSDHLPILARFRVEVDDD